MAKQQRDWLKLADTRRKQAAGRGVRRRRRRQPPVLASVAGLKRLYERTA